MITRRYFAPLAGAVVALAVAGAGERGFLLEKGRIEQDQRSRVASALGEHRAALEGALNETLHLMTGLVAYVQTQPRISRGALKSMLAALYAQGRNIRNIGLAPGNRLAYIYPERGNAAALGLYYPDLPEQWPAVKRAIDTRHPTLAGPLALKQGGVGVIYRVPVFRGPKHKYWGMISMVLDQQKLLQDAGVAPEVDGLKIALRGINGNGAVGGTILGDPRLFAADSVTESIRTPGGEWQIAAMPVNGWSHGSRLDWLRTASLVVAGILGFLVYFAAVSVARQLRAKEESERIHHDLNEAQRIAMIGSWVLDVRTGRLEWSDEIFRIFELDPSRFEASYSGFLNAIHPEDREQVNQSYTDSLANRTPYDITHRLLLPDGRIKYVRERCETTYGEDGAPLTSRGTIQDITQLQEAENALRASEERWKFALEGAGEGVWDWNLQTGEIFLSGQEMNVLGYEGEGPTHSTIGTWVDRQHPDDMARREEALHSYLEGRTPLYICEFRTRARDGRWRWLLARGMLVSRTPEGKPLRMIGTHADITARKEVEAALRESEEKLRVLANTDSLTGISNRRHFLEQVEVELARASRFHDPCALIMLDIDYFKNINDTHGHAIGDVVLRHFADTALRRLRKIDILGRLGGEEFGIFLPGTHAPGAMFLAEQLRALVEATPAQSNKGPIHFTVSLGVAEFDADDPLLESLMVRADIALYQAKKDGRNRVKSG